MIRYVILLIACLALTGCTSKQEAAMNNTRIESWKEANKHRTYSPVTITGITKIEGDNIKIITIQEHSELKAPDIQYDTSDADVAKTLIGVAGAVTGLKFLTDSQKVQVVEQPAPTIVTQPAPVVVK